MERRTPLGRGSPPGEGCFGVRNASEDNYKFLFSVVMLEKWIGWIESRTRGAD